MVADTHLPRFLDPRLLSSHFHIDEGAVVVDAGAGAGHFLPYVAKKVGRTGKVVACEIQRPLVETLGRRAQTLREAPIEVVWCDLTETRSTRLLDAAVDYILLINTLYQIDFKESAIRELNRILRPGGVVYMVDWIDGFSGLGPLEEEVVLPSQVTDLFEAQLFILERDYPAGAYHYGLSFRKL
jgi:ubiquinone/menaquinone biosynthesis C-methylase UbiE